MSQNAELSKVKARIKALSNKTVERGCSEHEAMEAMAAVGRLLTQYNLTMNEIDVREQICKTITIQLPGQRRGSVDGAMISLAALFDARVWFKSHYEKDKDSHRTVRKTAYAFFGTENDLEMIQYLYDTISKAIETETDNFKNSDEYKTSRARKSASVSFGHGMAARISDRLRDLKAEIDATTKAAVSTGTSLIVLKGQLIQEEFDKQHGFKLRPATSGRRCNNFAAFAKGVSAGDRVNLSRPIAGGSKFGGYLK